MAEKLSYKDKELMAGLYLFLSEQGPLSEEQMRVFDSKGSSYSDNFKKEKDEIINEIEVQLSDFCKEQFGKSIVQCSRHDVILKFFEKSIVQCNQHDGILKSFVQFFDQLSDGDAARNRKIAWELIHTYYFFLHPAKGSSGKQAIINRVAEAGKIDGSVIAEMKDTAETLVALRDYYGWISSMENHLDNAAEIKSIVDKDWKDTFRSIATLVAIG